MADGWQYILARADSLETIGPLRDADNRTVSEDLNKSGSSSCSINMKNKLAGLAYPLSTALVVQLDDEVKWSGYITTRSSNASGGRVTISAVGWFERLMFLEIQQKVTFTSTDAGNIVSALVGLARAQDPRLPITMGSVEGTQVRTITYEVGQSIGQAILDLSGLEAGFDFKVDPLTRVLNIYRRIGIYRSDCKWIYLGDGHSRFSNLADVDELVDGTIVRNDIRTQGRYARIQATDASSQYEYGVFQSTPNLSDVTDSNILAAYSNAEIVYLRQPRVTYTLTPKSSAQKKVPKLYRDFNVGDTTLLTARKNFISVTDQEQRIFGATLSISKLGVEMLSNLQTSIA